MAHFRGTLQGSRGQASRLGSKQSGITTDAQSWEGAVSVTLTHDERLDKDVALVEQHRHHGAGISRTLYRGPVGEPGPVGAEEPVVVIYQYGGAVQSVESNVPGLKVEVWTGPATSQHANLKEVW